MALQKIETFSFGGVDSRSNPANYPTNRAIRCLNWTPTLSGQLRLRNGYTAQLTNDTVGGTNSTIHSMVYYEQFSAAFLGPQYVLYGKGSGVNLYNLSTQLSAAIATMGSNSPWGHFRSNNRIFLSSGAAPTNTNATAAWENGDGISWDNVTSRPIGLPDLSKFGANAVNYAGSGSTASFGFGIDNWQSPSNIVGAPDSAYSTLSTAHGASNFLVATNFGFSIPTSAQILGMRVTTTMFADAQSANGLPVLTIIPWRSGAIMSGAQFAPFQQVPLSPTGMMFGNSTASFGANLTPSAVNDPSFGVAIQGSGFGGIRQPSLTTTIHGDACQITIFYRGASGTVSVTSSTNGSIVPTQLSGYQLYAAIYNPLTQHMGNRAPIGNAVTVSTAQSAFLVSGLADLSVYSPEWVYALGMTVDGGQVPHWFVDSQGNDIILANGQTNGTVFIGNTNILQELPFANDPPPKLDKFARVGTRIFGALGGNPFMSYSNDLTDVTNGNYVGNPEESWPGNQQQPLPTGELPTSIHAYRLEGWFFSRENLAIWSQFLQQQGANPWRGPWPGGCPSQRGFIETPHGPFWFTAQKELCTFMEDGVISVSDEYEMSLLTKIADINLRTVELGYLLDPNQLIDQIIIKGLDIGGNPVVVVHDFLLKEERSPHGQGYNFVYGGLSVQTFAGAGFTPRQNVYDTTGRQRLWAGAVQGFIAQLEDGLSDNGATYSADYIGMIATGKDRPVIPEIEYQGDPNVQWSYLSDYSLGINDFTAAIVDQIDQGDAQTGSRWGVKLETAESRWVYVRAQLISHPADGNFAITDPPFLPLPTYGLIGMAVPKKGAIRPEGR
jgi:hypothetical protein